MCPWRSSFVVPVSFKGITSTLIMYKASCMVLNERRPGVAMDFDLLTEEQGGFRKGCGC